MIVLLASGTHKTRACTHRPGSFHPHACMKEEPLHSANMAHIVTKDDLSIPSMISIVFHF